MKKKPLTPAERDWLAKLQSLLNECPSDRLGAYTIGDADIEIYDTRYESQINERLESGNVDFCSAVSDTGAGLISLKMPFCVHSTAG